MQEAPSNIHHYVAMLLLSLSFSMRDVFQSRVLNYITARFAQKKPCNPMFKVPQEIKAEDTILSLVFFLFTLLKEKLDKSYTHTTKQTVQLCDKRTMKSVR